MLINCFLCPFPHHRGVLQCIMLEFCPSIWAAYKNKKKSINAHVSVRFIVHCGLNKPRLETSCTYPSECKATWFTSSYFCYLTPLCTLRRCYTTWDVRQLASQQQISGNLWPLSKIVKFKCISFIINVHVQILTYAQPCQVFFKAELKSCSKKTAWQSFSVEETCKFLLPKIFPPGF